MIHWMGWCWNSNTLATWCEEPTHWKRPWCWERLKAGGEGDDSGWDVWMVSPTQWTWVWADSRRWWRTGKPGALQFMGSQRVGHDLVTEQQQQFYIELFEPLVIHLGLRGGSVVKNPPANAGDAGSIPGSGRSPREGNGTPLHYSCLGNPLDRGPWWITVPVVAKESDSP